MRRIQLKCGCGAEIVLEDNALTYIDKGKPDKNGDIYLLDKQAREWQDIHKKCLTEHEEYNG